MSTRTDEQRMAWCFKHSAEVVFNHYPKAVEIYSSRHKEIEVGIIEWYRDMASRSIKSPKHALAAWRKCVDELMASKENDE